ncbi:hypothetical protein FW774_13480 [Pedobacter sp. BS3]|uniref:FecR family protein n=1 Tax=Pedobacter sp. BS3 TaxID=2567937 RepID=UPI0011EEB1F6|nr:FecR domain-containing protein [Pedobacter sp. BS3]TZF82517.1 hypothetical protein FW774_13480 [Pedobacter sp. BS3]
MLQTYEVCLPGRFNGNTREVYLTGEAFFQVTHNPQKPFIAHTDGLNTCVLGTSFNINAYPQLAQVRVSVATGKASVTANHKVLAMLAANQQVAYTKATNIAHTGTYLQIMPIHGRMA